MARQGRNFPHGQPIPLMILLFPDGRLPSPRWRWAVGGYVTLAVTDMIAQAQMVAYALTHHRTQVDTGGLLLSNRRYAVVFEPLGLIFFACWFVAVGYQVVSWRRADGERLLVGVYAGLVLLATRVLPVAAGGGPRGLGRRGERGLEPAHVSVWINQRG